MKRFPKKGAVTSRRSQPGVGKRGSRTSARVRIGPELRAYLRKTDAYRAGRDPIPLMKAAPAKFVRAVAGLKPAQMRRRPARGKWSIIEILGHLTDTEIVYGWRLRLLLSQPGMPIQGYDQEKWTDTLRHRRGDPKRALERIRTAREWNLEIVQRVPRKEWKRWGIHSERGKESVRRTLELIAGHDLNHLDQIRSIRKKFGW